MIIGSPGRVLDMITKRFLYTDKLKIILFLMKQMKLYQSVLKKQFIILLKLFLKTLKYVCLVTIPPDIIELSTNFMNNPEKILVKKEALTLEGIKQFYINIRISDWKYDVLKDLYDTINIAQCIIYINSKNKLMEIFDKLNNDNFPVC